LRQADRFMVTWGEEGAKRQGREWYEGLIFQHPR
jgi:hypothetical protein